MSRRFAFPSEIDPVRPLVRAFVRRENRAGSRPRFDYEEYCRAGWFERFKYMGFPRTVTEKLDALLRAIGDRTRLGGNLDLELDDNDLVAEIAASNKSELQRLVELLEEQGLLQERTSDLFRLTAPGFLRLDALRKDPGVLDAGFVAMWFDPSLSSYRESVVSAVIHSGYEPVVVDAQEYNGFIMDRIIAEIRRSRFVIADFTAAKEDDDSSRPKVRGGSRGGVYWEAGMAYGLGKQVIHTCRDDIESRRRTHFDIDQYNTILWNEADLTPEVRHCIPSEAPHLAERLAARILSTLGRGSYRRPDRRNEE